MLQRDKVELESVFLSEDTSGFLTQMSNKSILEYKSRKFTAPQAKPGQYEVDLSLEQSFQNDSSVNNLGLDKIDFYLEEYKNQ